MTKKVIFNGIEILTEEEGNSAYTLLGFIETVIERLEHGLDSEDDNFHLRINMDFAPNRPPRHSFSTRDLSDAATKAKVSRILEKSSVKSAGLAAGTVKIDLQVEDEDEEES